MMKRLTKTCLTALLCSAALTNYAAAQELPAINDSRIDLSDFAPLGDLPVNPLPGDSGAPAINIPDGPELSISSGGRDLKTPATKLSPPESVSIAKPPTSINGATAATSTADGTAVADGTVIDTGEVYYEGLDGQLHEENIYEGVVEGEPYSVHSVLGFSALGFRRNYGEDRLIGSNRGGESLTTGDADHRQIGGFETYLIARDSNGVGWEFRYFGLFPSENTATLGGGPQTALIGLNDIATEPGGPTVADTFNNGSFQSLTRDTSIFNFEFNFLRNHSSTGWFNGILCNTESMIGLRYFDFDESLAYSTGSDSGDGPRSASFNQSVENSLFGLQGGGRSEFNIVGRFSGSFGLKLGAFYTRARSNRRIFGEFADGSAYNPSIQNGTTGVRGYDFSDSESDVSFLAELDFGLMYQINQSSRLRFGYRRLGISGLAFASNNIPDDVANVQQLGATDDNQSLRLRGIYFSYELAF
jgi:hypothetical protein